MEAAPVFSIGNIYEKLVSNSDDNIFHLQRGSEEFVLLGYPKWAAYSTERESDLWVAVIPYLDIENGKIYFSGKEFEKRTYLFGKPDIINSSSKVETSFEEFTNEFFDTIPDEIKTIAMKFPDSQWEIVNAIKMIGEKFVSFVNSNPSLAYLLINVEKLNPVFKLYSDIQKIESLIVKKQKKILSLAGFPETERMRKIFLKIDPKILSRNNLLRLRSAINNDEEQIILKTLSFSEEINMNLMLLIINPWDPIKHLSGKTIKQLITSAQFRNHISMIERILKNAALYKLKIPGIESIDEIAPVNTSIEAEILQIKKRENMFPAPPIEGNSHIFPLETVQAQTEWGKQQSNCIGSLTFRVKDGDRYFYGVHYHGEQATLAIKLTKKTMKMGDLNGYANSPVSKELEKLVRGWFEEK